MLLRNLDTLYLNHNRLTGACTGQLNLNATAHGRPIHRSLLLQCAGRIPAGLTHLSLFKSHNNMFIGSCAASVWGVVTYVLPASNIMHCSGRAVLPGKNRTQRKEFQRGPSSQPRPAHRPNNVGRLNQAPRHNVPDRANAWPDRDRRSRLDTKADVKVSTGASVPRWRLGMSSTKKGVGLKNVSTSTAPAPTRNGRADQSNDWRRR